MFFLIFLIPNIFLFKSPKEILLLIGNYIGMVVCKDTRNNKIFDKIIHSFMKY